MHAVSGYFNAIIEGEDVFKKMTGNGNCLKLLMIMGLLYETEARKIVHL
jgi:hypothetical protein